MGKRRRKTGEDAHVAHQIDLGLSPCMWGAYAGGGGQMCQGLMDYAFKKRGGKIAQTQNNMNNSPPSFPNFSCFDRPVLIRAARNGPSLERRVAGNSNGNGRTTHRRPLFLAQGRDDDEGSTELWGCLLILFCIRGVADACIAVRCPPNV